MKKLFLLVSLLSFHAIAQNAIIAGKVIDKDTQEPLIGANVVLDATSWGAATDINGLFKIKNVPAGIYTIKTSYVGYDSQSIENVILGKNDSLFFTVVLEVNFTLPEVVIQDKKLFEEKSTNTVRVLDSEQITHLPVNGL